MSAAQATRPKGVNMKAAAVQNDCVVDFKASMSVSPDASENGKAPTHDTILFSLEIVIK